MYSLDKNLLEKLLVFYPKIMFIEEQRKNIGAHTFHPDTPKFVFEVRTLIDEIVPFYMKG